MSNGDGKGSRLSALPKKMKMKMKMKTKMKKGPFFIAPKRPFSTSILMSALNILKQNQKREKKKKMMMMKLGDGIDDELKEMEVLVADIRSEQEYEKGLLKEGEARVKELQALLVQNRDRNNQQIAINLRDQLLANHIYFNIILPYP